MPLANGQITIVDLNDAILSGTAPANPVEGTLWIDTSVDPNKLYSWNGSNWIEQTLSVSALDPEFDQQVQDLKEFAKNAADDGMLSSGEKLNIKLLLVEITGETVFDATLPTLTEIDASKAGQVYMIRAEAKAAGIPTDQSDYTAFETAYADLKVYLESLTPRPWDKGNTVIDPLEWAVAWDTYYDKLTKLQVTTSTYLANSVKPGEDYNGVKMSKEQGVVVLRGDNLFRTTLNATQGLAIEKNNSGTWVKVFYTNTDGKMYATSLVIDSTSTIAGTTASTVRDNAANGLANANTANDKISLNTDTNNYNPNPSFEGKKNTYYTACTAFAASDTGVPAGAPKPYVGRQTGRDNYISDFFSVKAGEKFIVEGWIASTDSAYNFGLGLNAQDNAGTNTWLVSGHKSKGDGSWQYFSYTYTIPSNVTKARFFSQINASSNFGNWFFTDVRITKVIVDDVIASASTWNTAKDNVNDMLSDLKVTPLEKSQLSRDWEAIKAEYTSLIALANSVSASLPTPISTSAYTTAYNNLNGVSPKIQSEILANMNTTYTFVSASARDTFKTQMNTYFSESEKLKTTVNDKINGTAKDANDKITNLKVGGSNIMPNSSAEIDSDGDGIPDNWSIFQQASGLARDEGRISGYSLKAVANANPGSAIRTPSTSIKGGETYTISLWMKRSNDGDLSNLIKFRNASGTETNPIPASSVQATANMWTYLSQTITAPSDAVLMYQTPRMNTSPDGTVFWVDDVQVEVGNVATDWSAAQSDIDYFISKVQSNLDNLKVGGRNLAFNTSLKSDTSQWSGISTGWTRDTATTYNGNNSWKFAWTSSVTEQYPGVFTNYLDAADLIGKEVTFSAYIFVPSGKTLTDSPYIEVATYSDNSISNQGGANPSIKQVLVPKEGNGVWTRYSVTVTVPATNPYGNVQRIRAAIRFRGLAGATTDIFWASSPKLEKGNVVTDWDPAPEDWDGQITNVNNKVTDINTLVSNGDADIINANPRFFDWTGTLPAGYSSVSGTGLSKVKSGNGTGNAARFVVAAGGNHYLSPPSVTNLPFYQYVTVQATFMLESGSIDGAGILFRYNGTGYTDFYIKFKDLVPTPVTGKFYTVSKTIKQSASPSGFSGYQVYPMGGFTSFGTVTAKTIQIDEVMARPSTEQEIQAYESNIILTNMANDSLITRIERNGVKDKVIDIIGYVPFDTNSYTDDFGGKVVGSTTANPHVFKGAKTATLATPDIGGGVTEAAQSSIDAIKTLNGTTSSAWSTTTATEIPQHIFSFNLIELVKRNFSYTPTVQWLKDNISSIVVNWHGYGVSSAGNKASFTNWRADVNSWATASTHTNSTITKTTLTLDTSLVPYRIDSSGFVHFLANAEASNGTVTSAIYTDYIDFTVTMYKLPPTTWLDKSGTGSFYNSRKQALNAGVSTSDSTYVAVATQYNNLKTYLEGLTPIVPWNTVDTRDVAVVQATWKDKWLQYNESIKNLSETTANKLRQNAIDAVNGLQVGGNNILKKTGYYNGSYNLSGNVGTSVTTTVDLVDESTSPTGKALTLTRTDTSTNSGGRYWTVSSTDTVAGKKYTWSVWAKGSGTWSIGVERGGQQNIAITDTWTKYTYTFTANSSSYYQFTLYRVSGQTSGSITFHSLKLEEGDKATDWRPAQSDLDELITNAQSSADNAQNSANTAIKQGYVVTNPIFSDWTGTFPNYFSAWSSSTVAKETTLTRTGSAMRFNVAADATQVGATITSGFFIPKLPNNKYYAMELDFMLVSGSITGAAVLLDWNGMNPYRATVNLSEYVPSPSLNTWYTVRAIVKRPTDTLTGYTGMMGYLMANYSGSTTNKAKNIIYDRLVFREPTSEEIAAYEVTQIVNGRVEVDGGRLTANSVKAESIDAKRLSVKDNNGTQTFLIDNNGQVTVNGKVYINSNSIFAEGYDPSITPGGRNVLLNSRFTTADFTGWTPWGSPTSREVVDITDLPGFDKAVKFVLSDKNQGLLQNVSVIQGNKYTISAYVKSESGQPVLQVFDGSGWPSVAMSTADAGTGKWVRLSKVFIANASSVQAQIGRGGGGSNGTCYFTGVKIEEGDKTTGWSASPEDIDKLFDAVVSPDGTIKARDIASSLAVTPEAIQFISQAIDLKGKVTFSDLAQGWAYDENGNKINNSDQPDYDPANPLYLTTDGYYRPLSDENLFLSSVFTTDDAGKTVIDGNLIKTGTIQAKYADFMDLQVFNADGELSMWIDTDGNLSTVGTSKSAGYEAGKKGWKIDASGEAEFNSALFRGDIELGYYDAATDTFKVSGGVQSGQDASGRALRFWAGDSIDNAPFKVFSDGSLYATQGTFTGTFSGVVQVGNVTIQDNPDIAGDASITITDNALIEKVVLSESKVSINTNTTFGNFMNVDINNKKLLFGDSSFQLDYQNNLIQMNQYTIQGTSSLNFISDGSTGNDFVFKSTQGDTTVYAEGSFSVRDDISFLNTLVMRKASDSGNKGIDFVLI